MFSSPIHQRVRPIGESVCEGDRLLLQAIIESRIFIRLELADSLLIGDQAGLKFDLNPGEQEALLTWLLDSSDHSSHNVESKL